MNPEVNNPEGHVLVIGAAGIDVKARPSMPLQRGSASLGRIRFSLGGVARNIAENLARLEVPTVLLTAVGVDAYGDMVLHACQSVGIDISTALRIPDERTGGFLALATEQNDLAAGISDYTIMEHLTPDFLLDQRGLFEEASILVIDANISNESLEVIFDLADQYQVPVCADPTMPALAGKLCNFLPDLYLVAPNRAETTALCGLTTPTSIDSAIQSARHLVSLGVKIAIVTLGEQGLAYANSASSGHLPAIRTQVVDATGAGDALTAGVIFGLLNGVPLDEAMRLGVSAATLTLHSRESVLPQLSQELLYDELVI